MSGATVNRFCSSGLESIALSSLRVMSGWSEVIMAGGVESMSCVPMGGNFPRPHPDWAKTNPEVYMSMGITAENVAKRYKIARELQDEFCLSLAHEGRRGPEEQALHGNRTHPGRSIRRQAAERRRSCRTSMTACGATPPSRALPKLKPAFAARAPSRPGNSSQTTDGAAACIIMSEEAVKKYGAKPLVKIKCYTTVGCKADEMGVGPAIAMPKLLKMAGLKAEDIGLYEINEAFASQALYSAQVIGIGDKKFWASDSGRKG